MSVIDDYSRARLAPRLRNYGLNKDQRERICADVRTRLASLLSHWTDDAFRRTILTLGHEEATFWSPGEASLDIRSLVVLCVRNSLIEELNATRRGARQVLPDEEMPWLTSEAIDFFQNADLACAERSPGADLFGSLPRRFPHAWQALAALAGTDANEAVYSLRREKTPALDLALSRLRPTSRVVVASGMDAALDPVLTGVLRQVQKGELDVFFAPSFSRITRNPEKLLAIIDHVLQHGATLATSNYLLSDSYVACRNPLIRPAHTVDEAEEQRTNATGLTHLHRVCLGLA